MFVLFLLFLLLIDSFVATGLNDNPANSYNLQTELNNNELQTEKLNNNDLTKNTVNSMNSTLKGEDVKSNFTLENSTLMSEDVKSNSSTIDLHGFLHDMCNEVRNKNMSFPQFLSTYYDNIRDVFHVTSKDSPSFDALYYLLHGTSNLKEMDYKTMIILLKNETFAKFCNDLIE